MIRVRLGFSLLFVCGLSVVTAAASPDAVRFTASAGVVQMRVEVLSPSGAALYDSDWKGGNVLDWTMPVLPYGSYSVRIHSRDLEGRASEQQTTLHVAPEGITVDPAARRDLKLTATLHDGETGQLVTTSGDLSFRFGDFLNRKDVEVMRLTAEGNVGIGTDKPQERLDVNGLIRTSEGIMFPDGSMQRSAAVPTMGRMRPGNPETDTKKLIPKPDVGGSGTVNQIAKFVTAKSVGDSAVTEVGGNVGIGTSTPGQKLVVIGNVNAGTLTLSGNLALPSTASGGTAGVITLGGSRFAHNFGTNGTFLGLNAGNFTMTGANNIGVGVGALNNDAAGFSNTAVGTFALSATTTGNSNVAIGPSALTSNTVGFANVGIGDTALFLNTGNGNVAVGHFALQNNTSGGGNVALGGGAGKNLTTGSENIDLRNDGVAGESGTIRIGTSPFQSRAFLAGVRGVTTGAADGQGVLIDSNGQLGTIGNVSFSNNLALPSTASGGTAGVITLGGIRFAHNFGTGNTFLGFNAGNFTMTGQFNTAIGSGAYSNNTTGNSNTAIGVNALVFNTTGGSNTATGYQALMFNSGGSNAATGTSALQANTTGSGNTSMGAGAFQHVTTGSFNSALGFLAGDNLTTGDYNIDIGNAGVAAEGRTIRIGDNNQLRTFIAGINGVTTGGAAVAVLIDANGQLGTVSSSRRYKFDIASMGDATDGLMRLRPVTFRYLAHGDHAPLQYGLIAEDVAEVYPELVTRNKDGEVETVMYQFLTPMLLNEVQKQRRRIEEQQAENATLRDQLEKLTRRIDQLEAKRNATQ